MTLIRPQIALMDTDYFGQRIKTDDTDFTNYSLEREFDVIGEFGTSGPKRDDHRLHRWTRIILDNGLRRMTRIILNNGLRRMVRIVLIIKEIMMNYGNSFYGTFHSVFFEHECPSMPM